MSGDKKGAGGDPYIADTGMGFYFSLPAVYVS